MKKKNKSRFLSILLCFMFLFFVGCDGGPLGGGDDSSLESRSLSGTKVLRKPADYSYSEAVGSLASENYYNIFSAYLLNNLYKVYLTPDQSVQNTDLPPSILNGVTDFPAGDSEDVYYIYDSMRYQISKVETFYDDSAEVVEQKIYLNMIPWNWTADAEAEEDGTIFKNAGFTLGADNSILFDDVFFGNYGGEWNIIYQEFFLKIPSFSEYYATNSVKNIEETVELYWSSPYYQQKNGQEITEVNFFQDALEYATYMIVLGYDYVDKDGNPTEYADLFDFEIEKDPTTKAITGMKVNGWSNASLVSVQVALQNAKDIYEELGSYVGLTDTNKEQLKRFVLDKIIGPTAATNDGQSVVEFVNYKLDANDNWVDDADNITPDLTIKRSYDQIVENIINYACTKAPIGTNENGLVYLDEEYLASEIVEYKGDYFCMSYDNDDDSNMFKYIEAAEYQSMVLYPNELDLGAPLTDLWLGFEYYENPLPDKLVNAQSITINVGFRYFSASANNGAGEYIFSGEKQVTIKHGKNGTFEGEDPDVHWVYICDADDVADIHLNKEILLTKNFDNGIGSGAIDPFVSGTIIDPYHASMLISGQNKAREYYALNDSSSSGCFGTLNGTKFSKNEAGDHSSDFIEVYFDIVKEKGKLGINYNYKVGVVMLAMEESVY